MKYIKWTDELIKELRTLANAGKTPAEIAEILDINYNKIYVAAQRFGVKLQTKLPTDAWAHDEDIKLRKMVRQKKTGKQIAEVLKRTPSSVYRRCKRLNIRLANYQAPKPADPTKHLGKQYQNRAADDGHIHKVLMGMGRDFSGAPYPYGEGAAK